MSMGSLIFKRCILFMNCLLLIYFIHQSSLFLSFMALFLNFLLYSKHYPKEISNFPQCPNIELSAGATKLRHVCMIMPGSTNYLIYTFITWQRCACADWGSQIGDRVWRLADRRLEKIAGRDHSEQNSCLWVVEAVALATHFSFI